MFVDRGLMAATVAHYVYLNRPEIETAFEIGALLSLGSLALYAAALGE